MRKLLLLSAAGAALFVATGANASPLTYVILDGSTVIGSGSSSTGVLTSLAGMDANFLISGNATSEPFNNSPDFSTSTFNISSRGSAGGTLTIKITDIGLPTFSGNVANQFTLNPLNGSTFTVGSISNYFDASNTPYGTATLLATTGLITNNPGGTQTTSAAMLTPFSETTIYTLTFAAGGPSTVQASSSLLSVPEPASMGILGAGLAGIGLIRRRRRA